jgi:hypothetical protein
LNNTIRRSKTGIISAVNRIAVFVRTDITYSNLLCSGCDKREVDITACATAGTFIIIQFFSDISGSDGDG